MVGGRNSDEETDEETDMEPWAIWFGVAWSHPNSRRSLVTFEDYETRGALDGASTWSEVDRRVERVRAAISWMCAQRNRITADEVFGPGPGWVPRPWPPVSFRGLDNPLENVEWLALLHEASLDDDGAGNCWCEDFGSDSYPPSRQARQRRRYALVGP